MNDLLDITDRVQPVAVVGSGVTQPVAAYTDGRHFYFAEADAARVGAHLTGQVDLAGRVVRIERGDTGWAEHHGPTIVQVHQRHINGRTVFRFDTEWLFTVAAPASPSPSPSLG